LGEEKVGEAGQDLAAAGRQSAAPRRNFSRAEAVEAA
jgi:hypothetical protein